MAAGDQLRTVSTGLNNLQGQLRGQVGRLRAELDRMKHEQDQLVQTISTLEQVLRVLDSSHPQLNQLASRADEAERNAPK